jgi:signal transduction histidine kinase
MDAPRISRSSERAAALADAREQLSATVGILRVVAASPGDAQPVFDAIVGAGVRLFRGAALALSRAEGGQVRPLAIAEEDAERAARWRRVFPVPLSREYIHGAAILERRVVDVPDVLETGGQFEAGKRNLAPSGYRAMTVVPLMSRGEAIGALAVVRLAPGALSPRQIALLQGFADQAVIAIENARLFHEREARNRELAEALEQQAATSEILRVIARSPSDVRPVFDTIAAVARRLCRSRSANVFTFDGRLIHAAALTVTDPAALAAVRNAFPRPPGRELAAPRAILTRAVVEIRDVREDPDFLGQQVAATANFRSVLAVPLMREGEPLGAIAIGRPEPGPFPPQQVALLQTFADQAVIAIENTRLFNKTKEALERQTATSEVLRVISGSVTDTQPVFDVIAERAARLTGAKSGWVFTYDGEWIHGASAFGLNPEAVDAALALFPMRPSGASYTSRAIRDGVVMNVADALAETDPDYATKSVARLAGYRGVLSVPMFRGRQVLGAISVNRAEVGLFGETEVELLRTFADQAVIAIENTRLSKDREARNRELAEALEQQTATSEILRVIARSPTDVQPVFQTIADAALRLCDASVVNMLTFDGAVLHVGALAGLHGDGLAAARALYPRPPARDTVAGMAVQTGDVFTIEDVLADPHYSFRAGAQWGVRSALGIPLLRHGAPIGALAICRPVPGPFPDQLVALLRTFADQAVIAIENVRLFQELQDKTRQLEVANRHKSAFLANMSHELRTPLNAILGFTRIVLRETREAIAPRQAENLEKILASARHLVGLINATLDLTRIEAGRIEITASEIALAPLLDECLRSVEPLCADGVRLRCRIAADLAPMRVDAAKLHQILINLLGNAVKFTEQGWIALRAAQRDDRIVMEVEDTGIGVPADKLEAVFEEFEQVDASHTRAQGGTGLGLAIARRLARAMGGELAARSALGAGSTFTLTLPLRWSDDDEG